VAGATPEARREVLDGIQEILDLVDEPEASEAPQSNICTEKTPMGSHPTDEIAEN
jgi:hypothetical protein